MKKKTIAFILLAVLGFLANGDNYAASALISNIAKDLGIPVTSAAASVTAYMATFGIFTLIFGPLADRFGKVKVIKIAALGTALFSMAGALSYHLPSLVVLRALNGAFGAGIFPITIALVGEMYEKEHQHAKIALMMSIGFLGGALATAIGGTISFFGSWRAVYVVYGVGELIAALLIFKYLDHDKGKTKKFQFFKNYKDALSDTRLIRLIAILFLVGFAVLGSFTYMGNFILTNTTYNILVVGLILSLYGIGTVFGSKTVVPLRKRMPKIFMILTSGLGAFALFIFAYCGNIVFMGIGLFMFGFGYISVESSIVTTIQEKLHTKKGTAMSLIAFNLFLGGAVGTEVNALIIEHINITAVFVVSAIVLIIAGTLAQNCITKFELDKIDVINE